MVTKLLVTFLLLGCCQLTLTTNYRIWCYTGFKYIIGQEERQDAEECTSLFGLDNYCYKFTASASLEEVVKLGCSNAICMNIGNKCSKVDFAGVHGEMCCCNYGSYCNSTTFPSISLSYLIIPFLSWLLTFY